LAGIVLSHLGMLRLLQGRGQRDGGLSLVKFAPMLKSLHDDRRFKALLDKLKLPE
jgi:hypothetical protein